MCCRRREAAVAAARTPRVHPERRGAGGGGGHALPEADLGALAAESGRRGLVRRSNVFSSGTRNGHVWSDCQQSRLLE
jgi:hypothetical protein